jgi:hypothetical protein
MEPMTPLELKRIKLELINVAAARHGLEFKIEERLDEINRLKEHIKIQEAKEAELKEKIAAAGNPS